MTMRRVAAAAFLAFLAGPALADSYPYSGFFVDLLEDDTPEITAARCALSFFEQRPDGSFGHYHIDNKTFRATGEVRFLHYREGTCSFDEGTRIETCHSTLDLTTRNEQVYDMFTIYGDIGDTDVNYTYVDTLEDAKAFVAGGEVEGEAPDSGTYRRCPIDAAVIRAHIAPDDSTFSEGAISAFDDPSDALLRGDLAKGVLAKLKEAPSP
jgi:hypothetical protein